MRGKAQKETKIVRAFACSCGDENKHKMEEPKEFFNKRESYYNNTDPLTVIVFRLSGDYNAEIVGIPNDPGGWSAVHTKTREASTEEWETWIECDRVMDGVYLTYKMWVEHFGDKNNWETILDKENE